MTRQVLYVAHPLAPTSEEIAGKESDLLAWAEGTGHPDPARDPKHAAQLALQANLNRALRWLAWLRKSFPKTTFIAPWIASVMSGEDAMDPAQREAGLADDCAVVECCDGIALCGGRISSGMRREMEHKWGTPGEGGPFESEVYDLTHLGREPPDRMTLSLAVDRVLGKLAGLR